MPPKTRITKTEILTAAVNIVRDKGIDALNARILASRLKVSTQPIFSQYESMDSLKEDVISYAKRMYQWFIKQSTNNNACFDCVAFCMSYIQFAKKEKAETSSAF